MKKRNDEKRIFITMLALTAIAVAVVILLGFCSKESLITQPYTVQSGDSLDKLYYEYGSGSLEKWRYEVKRLNGMEESGLYTGDEIVILVSKGDKQ